MLIKDLPLTDDIIRILTINNLYSTEHLLKLSDKELLSLRGIGRSQLKYIRKALSWFNQKKETKIDESALLHIFRSMLDEKLSKVSHEINELRTVVLEQYRLIQSIQIEKQPDGVIKKINEKVPGFSSATHDLYRKLEEK